MIVKKLLIPFILLILLLAGCNTTPGILVKTGDSEQVVSAKTGKQFSVQLEGQLSTGYSWKLMEIPSAFKVIREDVIPQKNERDMTGGFEIQEFILSSAEKGEYTLTFNYAQHWKKKPEFVKTVTVKVKVD